MRDKKEIRSLILNSRKNMLFKERKDKYIYEHLLSNPEFKKATNIFIYCSTNIEVDTWNIIDFCLSNGKAVAVPLSDKDNCTMEFYLIKSIDELSVGYYGILEPTCQRDRIIIPNEDSIMIVPGLSYSTKGQRVGYGKGFYDRYLSKYNCYCIGLCYDENMYDDVNYNSLDKHVNCVITDTNYYLIEE